MEPGACNTSSLWATECPVLKQASPDHLSLKAGVPLNLTGSGFLSGLPICNIHTFSLYILILFLACRYSQNSTTLYTNATRHSSSLITCDAPSTSKPIVSNLDLVYFYNNPDLLLPFTDTSLPITYIDCAAYKNCSSCLAVANCGWCITETSMQCTTQLECSDVYMDNQCPGLYSIDPLVVSAEKAGDNLTLTGSNFVSYGIQAKIDGDIIVPTIFINSQTVLCFSRAFFSHV